MATSRTGTTRWKKVVREALHNAEIAGLTNCPTCKKTLDWTRPLLKPASPNVDHIIPHSRGGTDTIENARVICRECNQRRGAGSEPAATPDTFPLSKAW